MRNENPSFLEKSSTPQRVALHPASRVDQQERQSLLLKLLAPYRQPISRSVKLSRLSIISREIKKLSRWELEKLRCAQGNGPTDVTVTHLNLSNSQFAPHSPFNTMICPFPFSCLLPWANLTSHFWPPPPPPHLCLFIFLLLCIYIITMSESNFKIYGYFGHLFTIIM